MFGLNPNANIVPVFVLPFNSGILEVIASGCVDRFLPPKGCITAQAPIDESKRSISPRWEQQLSCESISVQADWSEADFPEGLERGESSDGASTRALATAVVPLVSKNARGKSTITSPRHFITSLPLSVTAATCLHSRFSSAAHFLKSSASSGETTTAILSCDSEIANSVPSSPSYFLDTASRFISKDGASSPIATDTPPAPKSLQRLIRRLALGLRNKR